LAAWFEIALWKRVIGALFVGLATGLALRYGMGAEAGGAFAETYIAWIGDLFLRLIRMLIVPLIFFTLVSGIIAMGDPKRLGSLGARTIGLYFGTTAIAVTLGLIMGTLVQPGSSLSPETFAGADASALDSARERAAEAGGLVDRLLNIVPTNPMAALADGNILQIIFFAIIFGVGILVAGEIAKPVANFMDGAAEAMMKVTVIVMETAPVGVFGLMATVMATQGLGVLESLGKLAIALYVACALHSALTYGGVIIKGVLGLPIMPFFRGVTDAQPWPIRRPVHRPPCPSPLAAQKKTWEWTRRWLVPCCRLAPRSTWMGQRFTSGWSHCSGPRPWASRSRLRSTSWWRSWRPWYRSVLRVFPAPACCCLARPCRRSGSATPRPR